MYDKGLAGDVCTRLALAVTAIAVAWLSGPAGAQSCKDLPPGPAKRQCVMQSHPEIFEKKKERCLQLAEQRGSATKGTEKGFMQSCMQGKVGS